LGNERSVKAIRGAITVERNSADAIAEGTTSLLKEIQHRNALRPADVISIFFTLTPDLDADFPARAARAAGWDVPMLDMQELPVPGALPMCIRVLLHVQREGPVRHAYLRSARRLRPDLEEQSHAGD
jgi:chorismate mutase